MIPSSSRAWVSRARSGSCITSLTISVATVGSMPRWTYMLRSSAASPSGLRRSDRRSTSSSRSMSSRWAVMDRYSPAAMEKDPAISPATPARRTNEAPGLAPATPRTRETLVTRPSLIPKTAARAPPPRTSRCWWTGMASCSCAWVTRLSVVRCSRPGSVPQRNRTLTSEEHSMTTIVDGVDAFHELVGKELGYSEWQTITQDRVNLFAEATDDHQWIHVDPERAKDGSLRSGHRPRVPDALAGPGPVEQGHPRREHQVRRQLRLQQGPLPLTGAGGRPDCAWA